MATLLRGYRNKLEQTPAAHYSISDRYLPVGADKIALECRLADLRQGLQPGDQAAMAVAVLELFEGFLSVRLSTDQAESAAAAYVAQVQGFPTWAVQRACKICAGRKTPFQPSAGELRAECDAVVAMARQEAADIAAVFDAAVYREPSEAERKRVTEKFNGLVADLKLRAPFEDARPRRDRQPTTVEANAALEARIVEARGPVTLSAEAMATMGVKREDAA